MDRTATDRPATIGADTIGPGADRPGADRPGADGQGPIEPDPTGRSADGPRASNARAAGTRAIGPDAPVRKDARPDPPRPAAPAPAARRQAAEARGRRGEAEAARFLEGRGWTIVATRVRTPAGEVDLVARRPGLVAFVEVKARGSAAARDLAIDAARLARVAAAAEFLAPRFAVAGEDIRIDVILLAPGLPPRHLENAWLG